MTLFPVVSAPRSPATPGKAPAARLAAAPNDPDPTGDLVGRAAAGEAAAWTELVHAHEKLLRSIGYRLRLSPEETDDAMQTTWLSLLTHIGALRDPGCVAGWLATTMRNAGLRMIRRRSREVLSEPWLHERRMDERWPDEVSEDTQVDSALIAAERDAAVWSAVDTLAPRQRQLLRALLSRPEPSYREVAKQLSMSVGSIGPTRQRALQRLQVVLTERFDAAELGLSA